MTPPNRCRSKKQQTRGVKDNQLHLEAPLKDRDAFGRTKAQQDAHALPVLCGAFRVLSMGWMPARDLDELTLRSKPRPDGVRSLVEALVWSSQDDTMIDIEYARRLVRKFEFFFNQWEGEPRRTKDEVLLLLRKAIVLGGGVVPSLPLAPIRSRHHAGGWTVSSRRAS